MQAKHWSSLWFLGYPQYNILPVAAHTHTYSTHHDIPLATRAILNQHIRVSVEESSGILGRCWFHPKPVVPSTWGRSFWTPTVLGRADCLAWQGSLASHVPPMPICQCLTFCVVISQESLELPCWFSYSVPGFHRSRLDPSWSRTLWHT